MAEPGPSRGAFIVLEGLDRSGKSTQVARLVEALHKQGRKAKLQKFPDRTTAIGKMIDSYLQSQSELDDRAIHLLFSANRWELVSSIEKSLMEGVSIVADRYAFSGIAFSAAKGLDFTYCLHPDKALPLPDLTIYLTLPPESASKRGEFGAERYETVQMQTRVRHQFELVADEVKRLHGDRRWATISAEGTIDEVGSRIWELVEALTVEQAIGKLWDGR